MPYGADSKRIVWRRIRNNPTALAVEVLSQLRQSYRNPPLAASEFIFDLTAKGMPRLASRLRPAQKFL
jgi:hypothetical protein